MADSTEQHIKRRSRQFARITELLALVIIAVFGITMFGALTGPGEDYPELAVMYGVYWFPTLFYLWALVAIRRTFLDLGQGALFAPTVARGLRHIGWSLLVGGAVNLIVIGIIQSSTLPRGFSTGDTYAFRGLKFDPAYIMLVMLGLALLLLARLIKAAAEHRAHAERLEAELSEFL